MFCVLHRRARIFNIHKVVSILYLILQSLIYTPTLFIFFTLEFEKNHIYFYSFNSLRNDASIYQYLQYMHFDQRIQYFTKHFKWGNKILPLLKVINLCDEFIDYLMELCVSGFLSVCSSIPLIVEV